MFLCFLLVDVLGSNLDILNLILTMPRKYITNISRPGQEHATFPLSLDLHLPHGP